MRNLAAFLVIALAVMALAIFAENAYAQQQATVTANVLVSCPFSINLNLLSAYVKTTNTITGNYAIKTLSSCNITTMQGYFNITFQSNGVLAYSNQITANNIGQSANTFALSFGTTNLINSTYVGTVSFSHNFFTNSSSKTFQLLNPANIVISNLSVSSSSVTTGSPLTFTVGIKNAGQLSASNIIVNLTITGPSSFNTIFTYPSQNLLAGSGETLTTTLTNVTSTAGTYNVVVSAAYYSNITQSDLLQYSVTQPSSGRSPSSGGGGGAPPPPPSGNTTGIGISTIPLSVSTVAGQGLTTQLGVVSKSTVPEVVQISIGDGFTSLLTLSSNEINLPAGGLASVSAVFQAPTNTLPGTYVIPITFTVRTTDGALITQFTDYLSFTVYGTVNGLQILQETYLSGGLTESSSVIQITNYGNSTVRNVTLTTTLPLLVAQNVSQITAYGLPNNITVGPGKYIITWRVGSIPPRQVVYGYYSIKKVQSVSLLSYAQSTFAVPTLAPTSSLLKVISISAPTFYTNATNLINITTFYSGTSAQPIDFYLTGPQVVDVANPTQIINAYPNQLLTTSFAVATDNFTGTALFTLYISTSGQTLNYSIPVLILSGQTLAQATNSTVTKQISNRLNMATYALEAVGVLTLAFITAVTINRLRRRPPRYDIERARSLARLKSKIINHD